MKNGILKSLLKDSWKAKEIYHLFSKDSPFDKETRQGKTGYCWLIAVLYEITHYIQKKYPGNSILFSTEYLIFYDKLEKANLFLEHVLDTLQLPDDDRVLLYLLSHVMTDEGQWQMAENLICKYGLVPINQAEAPVTLGSTGELNASISFLLRYRAAEIREKFQKGADYSDLKIYKEHILTEVEIILKKYYGVQPKMIEVPRYFVREKRSVSPIIFYNQYIKFPFEDFISVIDCGGDENRHYTYDVIELDGNIIEGKRNSFLHIPSDIFYTAIYEQIKNDQPCWIGCDAGKFQFSEYGIFDDGAFDLSKILGEDYEQKITKNIVFQYKMASANHALLLYDIAEKEDGMLWWRAQNSVQNPKTGNGDCYLSDSWLKKYLFYAVIDRKYIPFDIETKIRMVKPWELFMLA